MASSFTQRQIEVRPSGACIQWVPNRVYSRFGRTSILEAVSLTSGLHGLCDDVVLFSVIYVLPRIIIWHLVSLRDRSRYA